MNSQTFLITEVVPQLVEVRGALDFDVRGKGLSPRRLPDWTRMQVPQVMDVIVRMPSGVRLRFDTDATRVGLHFHATNLVNAGQTRRAITFNLESMGLESSGQILGASSILGNAIHLNSSKPGEFDLVRGDADRVWFDDLPPGQKSCELWLPHNAFMELRSLELDADAQLSASVADPRPRWLHYGSSISHCMEADEPAYTWPAVAARAAGANLQSLGFGGQCHLDQFVARTIRDSDADVVSIKTGINIINMDSMRERVFVPALHGFLDTIREGKPSVPIVLVSPIYCPSAEHNPGPTLPDAAGKFVTVPGHQEIRVGCMTLARTRELIEAVVSDRCSAGDLNLSYHNGLSLFGADEAHDLPDDLHPNAAGYIRMGERFAPVLAAALKRLGR